MIAWVSELTHGGHVCTFSDPALEEQARQEKDCPVWKALQEATQGGREGLGEVTSHLKLESTVAFSVFCPYSCTC